MLVLSKEERDRVRSLRACGALRDIDTGENGISKTAIVACPDGHQFSELYGKHINLCGGPHHHDVMHHPIALNGGGLLLKQDSPILRNSDGTYAPDGEVLLRHLGMTVELKQPEAIILYGHIPCGMARRCDLTIDEQVGLLMAGKARVLEFAKQYGITDVRAWMHVAYGNNHRRTYHVHRKTCEQILD